MFKLKEGLSPVTFSSKFNYLNHKYPTSYSYLGFKVPKRKSKYSTTSITYRGPYLWNRSLDITLKKEKSVSVFQNMLKRKLLYEVNEMKYF